MAEEKYIIIDNLGHVHRFFSVDEALIVINRYQWTDYEIAKIIDPDELQEKRLSLERWTK